MNYPVEYTVITENEKIYIEAAPIIGGCSTTSSATICGYAVLSETRSACLEQRQEGLY